ncbi:MAG: galactan 5-O-arabinofuranosyltransferase [Corynebacterium sp.]|nr:galactan 5-O-arabinofuranosyltransferase [Corynebacterium sp.]
MTSSGTEAGVGIEYTKDRLGTWATLVSILCAFFGGGIFMLICWKVLKHTHLPAFGASMVSRALATAGTVLVLVVVAALVMLWLNASDQHRSRRLLRPITYVVTYLSPAALVMTSTAIPLAATKLYLDGITVDQGFRTQFLTRLTDTTHLVDMNYIDMPSYYPGLWFWLGGRFAHLMHLSGWEAFQPWALITIAAVTSALVPIWQRLTGSLPVGVAIALVTTCIGLTVAAEEPYALLIALLMPAATVILTRGLRGDWLAIIAIGLYAGLSASTYTLYTVVLTLSFGVIALVVVVVKEHSLKPLLNIIWMAIIAAIIALPVWWGYFHAVLTGGVRPNATAGHYLPAQATQLPLPMLSWSIVGILCLIGTVVLIIRFNDKELRSMALSVIVFYCWIVASQIATLGGTTLLGFRVDTLIIFQLATAGVIGIAEIRTVGLYRFYPEAFNARTRQIVTFTLVTVLSFAGLSYAQSIPDRNHNSIDLAYTDTDGNGDRADLYPADSGQYYSQIDEYIRSFGYVPDQTVVLTDENNFMSYYPYFGFQAFTSHYANPLGEFSARNQTIESWATSSWVEINTPEKFQQELENSKWRSPDVFILRGNLNDFEGTNQSDHGASSGWRYDLSEDIYPNNPNVRFRGIFFNPAVFATGWHTQQIGPFVVIVAEKNE